MKSEIPEATKIVENIAGYTSIANVDYILSTFSSKRGGSKVDGRGSKTFVGDVTNFDDRKKFINALDKLAKREYPREKNEDCQEPTYTGIIRAITNGHPQRGSPMYVFTDAPPKALRDFTADNAIYHAQKNMIPVNFFLSKPFCGPKTMGSYRVIAEATGGLVLTFKKGSSMERLRRMIKGSLDGTAIVASDKNNRKREIKVYDKGFYIDDIAHEGTLEVEVKGTVADLLNPKNVKIYPEKADSGSLFWTILRPSRGTWRFSSQATNLDFQVKSQSKLDITLHWRFMRSATHIDHPLIGEKAKVEIEVPNISRLDKNTLSLPNDWILLSQNNDFYTYESKAPLSEEHFTIPMRGKTLSGFDFTRESYVIQPKIAVITSLVKPWFSPEVGKEFRYTASIGYANTQPMKFRMKLVTNFGGDRHNDYSDNYKDISLSRGVQTVSWALTAPTKGQFTAKIKLKNDDVEINFQDGPFYVREANS
ncbi:uncharacterized protein LOC114576682 [Exaiptasia diaphana]|uniref:Hemicentin-1-like von Willebrand factor A domain-containing protein n=1 Tax=Exaiptasia diaphana TaxID=2652724 RepID=A0A913YWY1_EXADI|nr:uncharacterized protein LOC114576682 [Exaiptasia diaphana]